MMRDLEIEEAKLSAVQEIESNHSKQASCISRQSTSSIKGSAIHHDTTSQKFDYRIDHDVHVKSGSGDVCSQFAGLNVDNGVIDNGVVVINKGVDVSCVGDSCVVDQTELGVSDSETVVKGTHVKQHNTTMVNKNQGLNFNAPAFVPSNNVKLLTKNQHSDHSVRHQVKHDDLIGQTPLINDHHLHHYVKHGVKQRGLVDQTALINNHHLDHCVTHRSKHRETVDETQLINNRPLDNCVGNTVEQRDPVDQTTLISNQPELCVGQRVKFSDSVNQTKTLPHYVTERNGSVSTASEHDISNISESNSSVSMALLIQSINHLANINRLPTPVPEIFEGDPLKYPAWKAAFQALIGGREIAPLEKIHYLKDYLGGKAKRCVEGFLLSPSAESYDAAMALIEKRYGDPFTIANAFKTKIENWQKISPKDHQGLRQFADFLRQCEVASHTNPSLNVLNDDVHNRTMLDKLPDWLVSRWARQVHRFRENYQCYPSFSEFVSFLVRESDIACDPVARLTGPQEKKTSSLSSKSFNIVATKLKCVFCSKENHMIENCFKLKEKTMEDRKAFIREKRLCFGCLKPGHSSLSCKRRLKCSECNKQHPTPLHGDVKPKPDSSNLSSNNSSQPNATKPAVVTQKKESGKSSKSHVSLMTNYSSYSKSTMIVPVWISSKDSKEEMLVYALLDTQSDTSFVSKATFSQLGISATDTKLSLSTMTSERRVIQSKRVEGLIVRGYNSDVEIQLPTVYLHDSIPASRDNIPTPEMTDAWPHLKSMSQHLLPKGDYDIGLLIGYNCPQALAPRDVIAGQGNSPFAQRTDLGWGIIGLLQSEDDSAHVFSTQTGSYIALRTSANEILPEISSESPPFLGNQYSQDDLKFVNMMMKGIHKTDDGHYQLPLPIRDIHHMPQNNKMVALQRLKGLAKRFDRDPQHFQFYKAFMKDIFESKYAEEVPPSEHDKPSFYLPHHGVYNPSKPGKVRVVMDASAKFKGLSLNDCLLSGPDLLNGLIGILCRFRQEHVAFMCDIKGMFQQFRVDEEDRNWLRFLWFKNDDYKSCPVEYRSRVHLFGLVSSPAVANFALKKAALDNEVKYGSDVRDFIHRNFYMDDGLKSVPTEEEAISLIHRSRALCQMNGLKLHKFVSNSREVLASLKDEDRADSLKTLDLSCDSLPIERALGVHWNIESDEFQFRVTVNSKANTRRGLLSTVSSIFDPLGFIAPVVLEGKMILQDACQMKLDWDDPLPHSLQVRWDRWLAELPVIKDVRIPRCFTPPEFGKIVKSELHYFSDASISGYGQCTYLRLVDDNENVHCSLVMAKARVAPLKTITIPRLELSAAVLSTEVFSMLDKELDLDTTHHFWTDSQITLGFIGADSKRFQVYVANRIQRIKDVSEADQWHHIATSENPADLASRGCNGNKLIKSPWLSGPPFLREMSWEPKSRPVILDEVYESELKKTCLTSVSAFSIEQIFPFSLKSWKHARNVLAICLRFIENVKTKRRRSVNVEDRQKAEKCLVSLIQSEGFHEEIKDIKSPEGQVRASSNIARLDPFVDAEGVLRVGGRIKNDKFLPYEIKHPVLLPKGHLLVQLFVRHCHEETKHQGKGMLISKIRSLGYWVVGLTSLVSSMLFKCVTCRKLRGSLQGQKMADLPDDRLEVGPPFTHVGLDYFGPFYIAHGRKEAKRYGVIFSCLTSRAVHLETAISLDSDSFINALRRFLSIRGHVRTIRCDRGTNLMGGISQIQDPANSISEPEVHRFLLENSCDFIVNVPHASHQGGVWERQIRTVRNVLNAMLMAQGKQLDDEGLRTFMYEAANIVNSRPLTAETLSDPTSVQPLTPNHLLTMKTSVVVPPSSHFYEADLFHRKRWRRVQFLSNLFWERWKKEYLTQLQSRQKWVKNKRNLRTDDIVLVVDEGLPRCQWKLGRIVEVYPSKDGLVRKVKLVLGEPGLTKEGKRTRTQRFLERPVHKLILLLENDSDNV